MLPQRSFIRCKYSIYFTLTMKSENYLLVVKVGSTIAPPMADIHIGEELRFEYSFYALQSEASCERNDCRNEVK
ncbi:MAG: hypothetical protein EZS28_052580 [Streblomastix strix]|uniref:Uncharacterized protein n=1 Tax=Streblomastix strix TaxID=222440 RepID=A0A5J4S2T9_9EUKA|nr:MAG: hypothetical protein EZS28_052580 [Streblomastix strix]